MQLELKQQRAVHYTLRIAVAMCFIGHGAFGIITKQVWCNYFGVFGIDQELSYRLMPVIGTIDILLGIGILLYPLRAIPVWLVIWGVFTAMLRPLSGEPFAEFVERAGNYGVPFALLLLEGFPDHKRKIFGRIDPGTQVSDRVLMRVRVTLRIVVFMLFLGHGWLNLIDKPGLLKQYAAMGFPYPAEVARWVGIAEIVAAFTVLIRPMRSVLLLLFIWKMTSELLYPQWELFEWIERGGSYGAILALLILSGHQTSLSFDQVKTSMQRKTVMKSVFEIFY